MPHTLFISDIHLQSTRSDITDRFLEVLTQKAPNADALYILGDLFEFWIGDDDNTPFHETILSAIQKLSRDTPVYFMRGNRDFLIGQTFAKKAGCQIIEDPTVINLYGQRVLLSHGDRLCTDDIKHQRFRNFTQNPKNNRFFLCLPLCLRKWIARKIRDRSQGYIQTLNSQTMDVTQTAVEEILSEHNVQLLIHGHTHRQAIHDLSVDGKPARRIVLGDWHKSASILIYDDTHRYCFE